MANIDYTILLTKISSLPEDLKMEAVDFIDFLLSKTKKEKALLKNEVAKKPNRVFGSGKGMFTIMPDFDEPLEDFKEYM